MLTLDPRNHRSIADSYAEASDLWRDRLLRRLRAEYGQVEYLVTVEQHLRGWPHWNVLLTGEGLMETIRAMGFEWRTVERHGATRRTRFAYWRTRVLARLVPSCGFGRRVWGEPVVCAQSMAAYFAKIVGEFCRAAEKPGDQRPLAAPLGTRRLRASPGLLPPRRKATGEWTGVLVDAPVRAFVDASTGQVADDWSIVRTACAMRQWTADRRAELEARLLADAKAWARAHEIEVVPRWGDPSWNPRAPLLADCLGPSEVGPAP